MFGLLLNLFFVWFCWEVANDHFAKGNTVLGWIGVAISAMNAAMIASLIF